MEQLEMSHLSDLDGLATQVVAAATAHKAQARGAFVVALHGDLGAGKTTFTQTLARTLGVTETVTSPTFVVMKKYPLPESVTTTTSLHELVHIDAYRIEDNDEMRVLGFERILADVHAVVCIEWAERIADLLPTDTLHIQFTLDGEKRFVTLSYGNH